MATFFEIGVEERLKNNQLLKLSKLIDWKRIEKLLKKVHLRDESKAPGEEGYNKLSMFKAILLGQWHSLALLHESVLESFYPIEILKL